jgi:hypothetical protein
MSSPILPSGRPSNPENGLVEPRRVSEHTIWAVPSVSGRRRHQVTDAGDGEALAP